MKSTQHPPILVLALATTFIAIGCVDETADGEFDTPADNASIESALEEVADEMGLGEDGSLGTLDSSDEAPAFGSSDLSDEFGGEDVGEFGGEDVGGSPEPPGDLAAAHPGARIFTILAVWGRIHRSDEVEPIQQQWDPTVTVTGGAVRVTRTLRFEARDHLERQVAPNEVSARSRTRPHVDGLILDVAINPDAVDAADVRFQSIPLGILIPAIQLVDLNQTHIIDGAGNGVMLVALERVPDAPCPHGFLGGRWARTRDNGGVFGGQWQSQTGAGAGFLAGRWGTTEAGDRVFHGKVINQAGEFQGLLSGTWGDGAFQGEMFGADGNVLGSLRGRTAGEDGHGHFRGIWRSSCNGPVDGLSVRVTPETVTLDDGITLEVIGSATTYIRVGMVLNDAGLDLELACRAEEQLADEVRAQCRVQEPASGCVSSAFGLIFRGSNGALMFHDPWSLSDWVDMGCPNQ